MLLWLLFSVDARAGTVTGKVTDAQGVSLPFATLYVQGTTQGTAANADGLYTLTLSPGSYKLVCQYMGFKQSVISVSIQGSETITRNFSLQEQGLEMKQVVVKANAEDPAYAIMRKVIARRKFHQQQVQSFQTSIYLKSVLRLRSMPTQVMGVEVRREASTDMAGIDSAGRGVLYLCEQFADYYAQEPNKEKTIIRSVKQSGDPKGVGFAKVPSVISFYQNNVLAMENISPRGFISPLSDGALNYYNYKYLGEFKENGQLIDKIAVTPKRQYEPCMQGTLYIVEGDWAIYSLSLLATKTSSLQTLDTIKLEQTHLKLGEDTWVIKSQVYYPTIRLLGFDATGYLHTVYEGQKINEPVPDSIFNSKVISEYDKNANTRDSTYWQDNRPVPLEQDEVADYTLKDSVRILMEDPRYIDSLRKRGNNVSLGGVLFSGIDLDGEMYKQRWLISPLLEIVNYNTVEGLNIAPKLQWRYEPDTGRILTIKAAGRYGFSNKHLNGIAQAQYRMNDNSWIGRYWQIGVQGGRYVFQYNDENPILPLFNSISTLFYGKNHMKIYERAEATAWLGRSYGNGLRWNMHTSYQQRQPLQNTTTHTWADGNIAPLTDNVPNALKGYTWEPHNAFLTTISVAYRPGTKYIQYPDFKQPLRSRWPLLAAEYRKGIKGVGNSKSDFDAWKFTVSDEVSLKLFGDLYYNISAGGFLNDNYVGLPDLMHLNGNQVVPASRYLHSFQLAPYYRFSNTEPIYGEAHVEYNLKGLLTNKIPVLRKALWYLVLGNNTFYANSGNYYTEAFVSIDNIGYKMFRFLRVDVVKNWDSYGQSHIGMRIGLKMDNILGLNLGQGAPEEW